MNAKTTTVRRIIAHVDYLAGQYTLAALDDGRHAFAWGRPLVEGGPVEHTGAAAGFSGAIIGDELLVRDHVRETAESVGQTDPGLARDLVARLAPFTDEEIGGLFVDYADHHGVDTENVLVDECSYDGRVVGVRLSLDVDGRSHDEDERFGLWR